MWTARTQPDRRFAPDAGKDARVPRKQSYVDG